MKLHELIKPGKFLDIITEGLSLNDIYYLSMVGGKNVVKDKFLVKLVDKGYVLDGNITIDGMNKLEEIYGKSSKRVKKVKQEYSKEFLDWWDKFPKTDNFSWKNQSFSGSRTLAVKKDGCNQLYTELLPKYTQATLLLSLESHITSLKNQSIKSNRNELAFLQNSHTYLLNETFKNWINVKVSENNSTQVQNVVSFV